MADESWQAAVQRHLFSALVFAMFLASSGRVLGTFFVSKKKDLASQKPPELKSGWPLWGTKSRQHLTKMGIKSGPKATKSQNQRTIALKRPPRASV